MQHVLDALTSIAGPFAFVFYDAISNRLFYGRDRLGRRSLLSRVLSDSGVAFCSITDESPSTVWTEVETGGVHVVDLSKSPVAPELLPWPIDFLRINRDLPSGQSPVLGIHSEVIFELERHLKESLHLRTEDIPSLGKTRGKEAFEDAKIAVLFSGGLDCTLLARLIHDLLPLGEPIDLLNVAFENPRSLAAASKQDRHVSPYEGCPDRKTGRASHLELLQVCKGRKWRFIAVDIPFDESEIHHKVITRLMAPHNTEMDLSIAKALYFAARGRGQVLDDASQGNRPCATGARVLISGLGADELFGGYTRHATAFSRQEYQGLIDELDLDVQRLGQRNLGRDDRIISHWAKEVRYPYLDEDFLGWTLRLPVWEKCGFTLNSVLLPKENFDPSSFAECAKEGSASDCLNISRAQENSPTFLDPAKQVLRLLAWRLGMVQVATEKKRAIQFGARTAKMHIGKGRKKGTDLID